MSTQSKTYPNWFNITAKDNFEKYVPKGDAPLLVLQIGVYTGDATEWLLNNRDVFLIHDVDTWEGSDEDAHESLDFEEIYEHYLDRFKDPIKNGLVESYRMSSDEFFGIHGNGSCLLGRNPCTTDHAYDLIYIDGDHTALQVAKDGLNAFTTLPEGGLLVFDDLNWGSGKGEFYDPRRGIEAVLHVIKDQVEILESGAQLWLRKK